MVIWLSRSCCGFFFVVALEIFLVVFLFVVLTAPYSIKLLIISLVGIRRAV